MKLSFSLSTILLAATTTTNTVNAFAGITPPTTTTSTNEISRRDSFANVATLIGGGIATSILPSSIANAMPDDETARITTRMGGLLDRYQDVNLGISILAPSGWNKFEGEVGAYNLKWQDLVGDDNIKISSTPVKSTTTSISALGEDVQALGLSLAEKRNAKLIKANERFTDGVLYYEFDFAIKDDTHQLLSLSVLKGRVWSVDANCQEKRYAKRAEMYNNVIGSFVPKLT